MSETKYGEVRQVKRDGVLVWQLRCPGCGSWGDLDDDMANGRVSVDHTPDGCTYHETHDFVAAFREARHD